MKSAAARQVGRSRWIVALGVSFTALVLLALVPVFLDRQEDRLEREIETFSLARPMLPEVALVHSREMMRIEQYVNSGDPSFVTSYQSDLRREEDLLNDLRQVIRSMPATYRSDLAQLEARSSDWKVLHSPLMEPGVIATTPQEFRESMGDDRARYEALRTAFRAFEDRLISDATSASFRLERQRALQFWIIVGAIGLAVAGALAMVIVGVGLQDLARSETQRRLETVAARRKVRAILRGTTDGLIGLDLDGCCTFLNEAGARMLGYSPRDLRGKRVHGLIHHANQDGSEHSEGGWPAKLSAGSEKTVRILDEILWRKDGSFFPVQLTVSPMTDGLEARGVVLTFTDMTEIRAAEDALRDAVQARDEVMAVVSHDLRNPVGTIAAAAELMADAELPTAQQSENLDIIQRSAYRINRLIQDLLDVARIEAGRFSVRTEALDLSEVIEDAVSQAGLQASIKNIQVSSEVPSSLPLVQADRDRILQVLENLLDNGIKFTPEGGSVLVLAIPTDGGVSLTVSDTGPGIEPELRDHLFDRFWKGNRSGLKGAGLGLAIVRGILRAHGAGVEVETEMGEGSAFSFILSLAN